MREILFRGQEPYTGEWCYGKLTELKEKHGHIEAGYYLSNGAGMPFAFHVSGNTVGQWTGLTDKNGVKIFEGDIVKSPLPAGLHSNGRTKFEEMVSRVFYSELGAAFRLSWRSVYSPYHMYQTGPSEYEIIGNIHDTPELLGGEGKVNHESK